MEISASLYRYTDDCEGQPCPGDCDECSRNTEDETDVTKTPYAEWLEGLIEAIVDYKPDSIGVAMSQDNGEYVMTAYYHADAHDKSVFIENIRSDWVMDIIQANADTIRNYLIDAENDYLEDENDDVE